LIFDFSRHAARLLKGDVMIRTYALIWFLLAALLPVSALAQDAEISDGQQTWVVNDYSYVPGSDQDDPMTGLSLCGTRCNAMTTDYRNILDSRGWRLIRVAQNRQLTVPLDNPFIGGHCICIADEYLVKLNEFDGRGQNRQ